jgi:YD repeat-containing protein
VNFASARAGASATMLEGTKEQDGLTGPVHRVRTERVKLLVQSGNLVEGPRELLESTTYDLQGRRTQNAYYLVSGGQQQTGKEEYKYDDKGNVVEMELRDRGNNSTISKEVYTYEFDAVGNWTKMNTFLVVLEAGNMRYEPSEVTYRNITYYYNQTVADITKHTSPPTGISTETRAPSTDAEQASSSLRGLLDEWVAATNARDIDQQMSFYAPTLDTYYRASNVSRDFVRADKARVFGRADQIEVRAGAPEITVDREGRTATIYFNKQYEIRGGGQDRRGEVVQELRWRLTDKGWEIVGERDVSVIR